MYKINLLKKTNLFDITLYILPTNVHSYVVPFNIYNHVCPLAKYNRDTLLLFLYLHIVEAQYSQSINQ